MVFKTRLNNTVTRTHNVLSHQSTVIRRHPEATPQLKLVSKTETKNAYCWRNCFISAMVQFR